MKPVLMPQHKGGFYAWEAAVGMAIDRPLTGVGLDNFYYNYYFYSPHWDGLNHAVHSTWFGVHRNRVYRFDCIFWWLSFVYCVPPIVLLALSQYIIQNVTR